MKLDGCIDWNIVLQEKNQDNSPNVWNTESI